MTKRRPSSETMATAFLTVLSLVGGLAVACTAGVGVRTVSDAAAHPPKPTAASPSPTPTPSPTSDPPLANPRLRFPADAVVDVKAAYRAAGDGQTDDTAAIQRAITENPGRTLYLPAGTYLVSKALEARDRSGRWQAGLRLVGEERDTTVIRLKDHATGFGDRWNPRPLLRAGASVVPAGRESTSGYGNQLENFSVDTGVNPGATGIDYTGSNMAAIRRVTISGQGTTGLTITRGLPGPALISRVVVKGFEYGIQVAQGPYGLTLEHVELSGQKIAGLENAGNNLAIRDLTSTNTVPAIRSSDRMGFISLVDAKLTGGTGDFSAIQSNGELMVRRVDSVGYRSALTQNGKIVPDAQVAQYTSRSAIAPFPEAQSKALDLPVRETPDYVPAQPTDWVSVAAYGAKPDDNDDDTAAFQKALDAGKPVVYLPTGRYVISRPLHVKGAVREVAGFGSTLVPAGTAWADPATPTPLIQVDDGTGADVTVVGLTVTRAAKAPAPTGGLVGFVQHTTRALILRDLGCCGAGKASYQAQAGAGPLYVENVAAAGWQFDQPQQVWARQFSNVDDGVTDQKVQTARLVNSGATVWVLGFESELRGPLVRTERGGRTEVLGGAVYEMAGGNDVAFECVDEASMVLSFATMGPGYGVYRVLARERRGEANKDLARLQAAWRGEGRSVPLYTG
jgi:Pectate lyase superfamily protein